MNKQELEKKVEDLEHEIEELKKRAGIERKTVFIDDTVPYGEVKRRVYEYMHDHPDKSFETFELMEILHLEPLAIKKALMELEGEGIVG